jgi:pilus assembly protein CpaE
MTSPAHRMKIKVVSASATRAEQVAQLIRESGDALDISTVTGTVKTLPPFINGSRPSLLVVDGADAGELEALGVLAHVHPDLETIVISPEQSPAFLLRAMQMGVREVLPPAVNATALQAAVRRVAHKRAPAPAAPQGEVLAFMACKGGSGASFIAANIAHILSTQSERKVALIDLDLQFGNSLLLLSDQRAVNDVAEVARSIGRLDADLLRASMVQVSGNLSVLAAPEDLSQALEVKAAHVEAIIKEARQVFDYVVLDVGRSMDTVSLKALDLATHVFPVLQLSLPQIRDAKRLRALFRSLEYAPEKIHWVVNRHQKGGEIDLESMEQTLGVKGLTTIPNHFKGVNASVNQGIPIDRLAPGNPVARALGDLARKVAPPQGGARKDGWLASMFGNA